MIAGSRAPEWQPAWLPARIGEVVIVSFLSMTLPFAAIAHVTPPPDASPRPATALPGASARLDWSFGAVQDAAPTGGEADPADDWEVRFSPSLWLVGMDGDVVVGPVTAHINADFAEMVDESDSIFAISGRVEVWKGRFGAYMDGLFAQLGVDDASGPLGLAKIDITLDLTLIDFGLMYRLAEWPAAADGPAAGRTCMLEMYAGGRYTDLDVELDPAMAASRDEGVYWIDPLVGAKLLLPLTADLTLAAWGDVGGFGVESDFAWSATAVFAWEMTLFDKPARLYAGYRGLGQDFEEGGGLNEFDWDVILHGPILGMSMTF
jgi:hypothetical protein